MICRDLVISRPPMSVMNAVDAGHDVKDDSVLTLDVTKCGSKMVYKLCHRSSKVKDRPHMVAKNFF